MSKSLLIVESPAKAKTIKKYVGDGFEVLASKGHIKDLPKRGGVDVDDGFQETYELLEEKGKDEIVKEIRASAKKADRVLLATDPDREGEAIAFHLMEIVQSANKGVPISRVLFNEITKKGVQQGLANPRELDTSLYEAQRTRRVLDRIGGYPLSNLLWTKLAYGLSAGRVQTPALRIIVDRQREHDAFVPQNYWLIEAQVAAAVPPGFVASLVEANGEKLERVGSRPAATSEPQAAKLVADLKKAKLVVRKVQKREQRRRAPAPYTTSKLQQDASSRIGMAPKRAMRIAQQLYEGVTIGKGKGAELVGLVTYIRTDSTRLSADAVIAVREHIVETYGKDAIPPEANEFKSKNANVQDAHEAIRPTRLDLPPAAVAGDLTAEQLRLYQLIWDRFVACQMTPAVYDQTAAEIEARVEGADARTHLLRASGSVLKVPGWKAVYGASAAPLAGEETPGEDDEGTLLPPLEEGMALTLTGEGARSLHKQTEPPPLFSEATLIRKLEEEGLGRPSTYSEIVSKVQARDYVKNEKGRLVATDLGKLVIEKLVEENFDLADIGFTRKLEESLDAVAEARARRIDVLAPFHERITKQIEVAKSHKGKWWPEPEDIGEACPECGAGLQKRWGKNGPFIGCPKYPECKYTRNLATADGESREPELTAYKCELCGSAMMKRWGRNGFFLGCSAYPKCKSTRPVPLGVKCPLCKTGDIVEIKGRGRGRSFYGCTNYSSEQKCEFRSWQKPIKADCPQCGTEFFVRGGTKKAPVMKCANPTCSYERELEDTEGAEGAESEETPERDRASNE